MACSPPGAQGQIVCGAAGVRVGPVIHFSSWNNSFLPALITKPINYITKAKNL